MDTRFVLVNLAKDFSIDIFSRKYSIDLYNKHENVVIWQPSDEGSNSTTDLLWGGWPRKIAGNTGLIENDIMDEISFYSTSRRKVAGSTPPVATLSLVFGLLFDKPSDVASNGFIREETLTKIEEEIAKWKKNDDHDKTLLDVKLVLLFRTGSEQEEEISISKYLIDNNKMYSLSVFIADQPVNADEIDKLQFSGLRAIMDLLRFNSQEFRRYSDKKKSIGILAESPNISRPIMFGKNIWLKITNGTKLAPEINRKNNDEKSDLFKNLVEKVKDFNDFNKHSGLNINNELHESLASTRSKSEIISIVDSLLLDKVQTCKKNYDNLLLNRNDVEKKGEEINTIVKSIGSNNDLSEGDIKKGLELLEVERDKLIDCCKKERKEMSDHFDQNKIQENVNKISTNDILNKLDKQNKELEEAKRQVIKRSKNLPKIKITMLLVFFIAFVFFLPNIFRKIGIDEAGFGKYLEYNFSSFFMILLFLMTLVFLWLWNRYKYTQSVKKVNKTISNVVNLVGEIYEGAAKQKRYSISANWLHNSISEIKKINDLHAISDLKDAISMLNESDYGDRNFQKGSNSYSDGEPRQRLISLLSTDIVRGEYTLIDIKFSGEVSGFKANSSYYLNTDSDVVNVRVF